MSVRLRGSHREELRFLDEHFWAAPRLTTSLMGRDRFVLSEGV